MEKICKFQTLCSHYFVGFKEEFSKMYWTLENTHFSFDMLIKTLKQNKLKETPPSVYYLSMALSKIHYDLQLIQQWLFHRRHRYPCNIESLIINNWMHYRHWSSNLECTLVDEDGGLPLQSFLIKHYLLQRKQASHLEHSAIALSPYLLLVL